MGASFFIVAGEKTGMILKDLMRLLDEVAPFTMKEEWDNPGLQVGDPSMEITRVLVSLDPTKEAISRAIELGAELLLTHHPLIFRSINTINRREYPGDIIYYAIKSNISVVSMHTNLDISIHGINSLLAQEFNLKDVEPLSKKENCIQEGAGIGVLGELDPAQTLDEFLKRTKSILRNDYLRVVGDGSLVIRKVAIVGGSGGEFISLSRQRGADLLLTGDLGHHHGLEAKRIGLALIDGGHFFTESTSMKLFSRKLKDLFNDNNIHIEVLYFEDEGSPYGFY